MSWVIEKEAGKLLANFENSLLEKEAENNFLLQALTRTIQNSKTSNVGFSHPNGSLAFLYEGTLLFSTGASAVGELAPILTSTLPDSRKLVRKSFGPENSILEFTRAWLKENKGLNITNQFAMILHKLSYVNSVSKTTGQFRRAWIEEIEQLAEWYKLFWIETGVGNDTGLTEEQIVLQMINNKQLFVWGDSRAVSMAGVSGSTPKGIRINCVYTPEDKRGKSYAKSLVASLSELQLSQGKEFVVLFTDALKPENAALYNKVGFKPLSNYLNYWFSN